MPKFDIENNQITFSFARGDDTPEENIKLSKGKKVILFGVFFIR